MVDTGRISRGRATGPVALAPVFKIRRPMRLVWYIFRSLLVATLFATVVATAAIWVTQALRLIDFVIKAGAPLAMFLQMMVMTIPTFIGVILPIALAAAVMFIYNKMTTDSELVVMWSAGVGNGRLALPAVGLGALVMALVLAVNLYLSPYANRELVRLKYVVRNDYAAVLVSEGAFNQLGDALTIYVRARSDTGEMRGIMVHDERLPGSEVIVFARRGLMAESSGTIRLVLEDGLRQELKPATGDFSELHFDRYVVELDLAEGTGADRFPDVRERSVDELVSPPERVANNADRLRQFAAELHMRLATPLIPLAFALVAVASLLSGDYSRRGQGRRMALAAVIILVIQSSAIGLAGLASKDATFIPVMYLAFGLPIPVAGWALLRR